MNPLVAVDWGTSSFRAWVLDAEGEPIAERRSGDGMQAVAAGRFPDVLRAHVEAFHAEGAIEKGATPDIVLCGMVGARQGWIEAPYGELPASPVSIAAQAVDAPDTPYRAKILPGVARRNPDRPDVMRGEETQILGLLLGRPALDAQAVLPGTHSKWVFLEGGRVMDFATVMTGELFALLSSQSILRHSIGTAKPSGNPQSTEFQKGLEIGIDAPAKAIERLFSLRPLQLLFGADGEAIADRLSGILIGAEVGSHLVPGAGAVELVASGPAAGLYAEAIRIAGGTATIIDADIAVRAGLSHAAGILFAGKHA